MIDPNPDLPSAATFPADRFIESSSGDPPPPGPTGAALSPVDRRLAELFAADPRSTDLALATAADFESWAAVLLGDWWPTLTGGLTPPPTTLRTWRALDDTAQIFSVEFVVRAPATVDVFATAAASFDRLGLRRDEREWSQSRGRHLVGSSAEATAHLRYSPATGTVFLRLHSARCRLSAEAGRRLCRRPEATLPFPDTTRGPLDIRVARNSARHLLATHSAHLTTPADPLQLGPPDHVVDIGWAYLFPWSTVSWYREGARPLLAPGARGPIVVVKDSGHTWQLESLSSYHAQLVAYALDYDYPELTHHPD
ncbi:hypothetical protein [Nocardia callitridis]|uniref:Uncharacterized protein n=1 Tax=Nocardia callitridis TaxID=648753 RepID=A0ABP9KXD3_9NOCA